MARGPRLDCPGAVHHLRARGIERRPIFVADEDRQDFVVRLATLSQRFLVAVYAWTLMPNHVHLVLRSGPLGISSFARRLLGGYASAFNRRYDRAGYLFQGRFKSTLVDAEAYLLEVIRYVHLNPVRAGIVPAVAALERYPWSGHASLVGTREVAWQAVADVLQLFAPEVALARARYRAFVAGGGTADGPRPLAVEGICYPAPPFVRTSGRRSRGREAWTLDERILGSAAFMRRVVVDASPSSVPTPDPHPDQTLRREIDRISATSGVPAAELCGSSKRRDLVALRRLTCARAVVELGLPTRLVATTLRVSTRTVVRAADAARRCRLARSA